MEFSPQEVERLMKDLQAQIKLKDEDAYNVKLMLEEAVTNAIQHGNECDTSLKVTVRIEIDGKKLTITITDQGQGFDHTKVVHPIEEEKEEFKSSGRGIFLIRKLADQVFIGIAQHI